jgi:hypothetical protein
MVREGSDADKPVNDVVLAVLQAAEGCGDVDDDLSYFWSIPRPCNCHGYQSLSSSSARPAEIYWHTKTTWRTNVNVHGADFTRFSDRSDPCTTSIWI